MAEHPDRSQPLKGLKVLDFSQYLPGPLATLMLTEAGADVLKVEPPGGDPMRHLRVSMDSGEPLFNMLNRGKRSVCVDLKSKSGKAFIVSQLPQCDIVVEQFRPGVMSRLGLAYKHVKRIRDDIIYCSISGYGQNGSSADKAGHDLNYQTEAGLISMVTKQGVEPVLPSALFADIAGGSYPAMVNILLAVIQRNLSGQGSYLDIAMADNLSPFIFWIFPGLAQGSAPNPGAELFTGGSPRYNFYKTADDQWLALAPLEEPFWQRFCDLIELEQDFRRADADPEITIARVRYLVVQQTARYWLDLFAGQDVCCSLVEFPKAELRHMDFYNGIDTIIDDGFTKELPKAPSLGEANLELGL